MKKFAIIFTVENKGNKGFNGVTSTIEKLSVVLATSVREHMPDVDLYCGCFTNNKLSTDIRNRLLKLKVNIVEDLVFDNIDSNPTALFLRIFAKDYFAKKLLDQYDYLIYLDVDCLVLKPITFDFDPTDAIALVEQVPDWIKQFEFGQNVPNCNLYYNWIDIINNKNKFVFELDWSDISKLMEKNADIEFSKKIDNSNLKIIHQTIGANEGKHELTTEHQITHYDDVGPNGNFIDLEKIYPETYKKYKLLIEMVLGLKIKNEKGFFKRVKERFMKAEVLKYSYKHKLGHIPSALSMFDYVYTLFTTGKINREDKIILGKPFGAQTYYVIWKSLGWIDDIDSLSVGVKHDEIPFVTFSEETMGNALGIAAGVAMTTDKLVWVNLTDASLQMGPTLEAIQYIGHNKLKNVLVTIDYNNAQVTGKTSDILKVDPVIGLFDNYDWEVLHNDLSNFKIGDKPKVFVMHTIKGKGIASMEQNQKLWHYKKITDETELNQLIKELENV